MRSPHVPCFVRLFLTKTPSRASRQRSRAARRRGSSPTPQATVLAARGVNSPEKATGWQRVKTSGAPRTMLHCAQDHETNLADQATASQAGLPTAPRPSFMIPSRNANTRKLHAQPLTPSHKDPCPSSSTTIPLLMWLKASHVRLSNAELNKQLRAWTGVEPDMGFASWQRGLQDRTIATAGWSTTPACGG